MYAVLKISGRQYRVSPGDSFEVEKLEGDLASSLDLTEVLMIGGDQTLIGAPTVPGAKVTCVVESQFRGTKVLVFKKKRRNNYKKMQGHRSELTRLFVSEISSSLGTFTAENKPQIHNPNAAKKVIAKQTKAERKASEAAEAGEGALSNLKKPKQKAKAGGKSKSGAKSKPSASKKKSSATKGKVKTKAKSNK